MIAADEEQIIEFCGEHRSREEVAKGLCVQVEAARRPRTLLLVRVEKLTLTMPDVPRSKFQGYVRVR